jgi:ribosomal protein L17
MPGGAPKGNRNGAHGREFAAALRAELASFQNSAIGIERGQALRRVARRLIESGIKGELPAIAELANRLDGKPSQTIDANIDAGAGLLAILTELGKGNDPPVA